MLRFFLIYHEGDTFNVNAIIDYDAHLLMTLRRYQFYVV